MTPTTATGSQLDRFLAKNPRALDQFIEAAAQAQEAGKKLGARAILKALRDHGVRCDNGLAPEFAKAAMRKDDRLSGYFEVADEDGTESEPASEVQEVAIAPDTVVKSKKKAAETAAPVEVIVKDKVEVTVGAGPDLAERQAAAAPLNAELAKLDPTPKLGKKGQAKADAEKAALHKVVDARVAEDKPAKAPKTAAEPKAAKAPKAPAAEGAAKPKRQGTKEPCTNCDHPRTVARGLCNACYTFVIRGRGDRPVSLEEKRRNRVAQGDPQAG